jgi:hypothetical protein
MKIKKYNTVAAVNRRISENSPVSQIIANHLIVNDYAKIPQAYIDIVKTYLLNIPGESHGGAYMYGLSLLAAAESKFAVNITWSGAPESPTSDHLRAVRTYRNSSNGWNTEGGESNIYTNAAAITNIKNHLDYMAAQSNPVKAFMFGWCWDMVWHNAVTSTQDSVHGCGWAGSSVGGPDGDLPWGLDAADSAITGNSVCMDTYLNAMEEYRTYAPNVKIVFTTGPADNYWSTETGYQRHVKHEYIRSFVAANQNRILFDWDDILQYNAAGQRYTASSWNGHSWVQTHYDENIAEYDGGNGSCHTSEAGCLKLGKALWWMLARIAGWDGN